MCALRRTTGLPLDALTFVVSDFLPHLNRDAVYRILKAEGLMLYSYADVEIVLRSLQWPPTARGERALIPGGAVSAPRR